MPHKGSSPRTLDLFEVTLTIPTPSAVPADPPRLVSLSDAQLAQQLGAKSSRSHKASSALQEGQRKAVRAALLAGVAPTQVAKHFRLSLATMRKVLEGAG